MQAACGGAIGCGMFSAFCSLVFFVFLSPQNFARAAEGFEIHKDFSNAHGHALRMSLNFTEVPKVMVEAMGELKLIDRKTNKLVEFRLDEVEASMFSEDMQHLPIPVRITEVDDGHYHISNLYFIMGGRWDLKVKMALDDHSYQLINIPLEFDPFSGICRTQPSN